jgi:pimeloyl-ACP methyl ester carboxylesterase
MRKGYSDGPYGQIHWRVSDAETSGARDLYCFHPAPFSGIAYAGIAPYLRKARRLVMPDYPGYGGSDRHTAKPTIDDYADAMAAVIVDVSSDKPVDLMGFHTGCLVAAELCRREPDWFCKACLIDVPAFPADKRADMAAMASAPLALTENLSSLSKPWESGVVKRLESGSMDRAFEMFVEQLRPGREMNAAFHAAFSYPWEDRLPTIKTQTLVLATQSPLLEGSRKTAEVIPGAALVERLDIKRSVLDEAAEKTAGEIVSFLTGDE